MKRATVNEVLVELREHVKQDHERFETQGKKLEEIHTDVRSLLESRSFLRGAWRTITVIAGIVATIVTLVAKAFGEN